MSTTTTTDHPAVAVRPSGLEPALLYAVSFLVHLGLGLGMRNPIIHPDEGGYLGAAHYFAHGTGLLDVTSQYQPAYSLLLAPFQLLWDDPLTVYRAALVLNAALLATVSLSVLALARLLLPDVSGRRRVAIAVVVGLYPPFLLFSNLAMAESLFIAVFMLACAMGGYAVRGNRLSSWFAFGLFTGLLYAIDPVGLVVIAAACLLALRVVWRRAARRLQSTIALLAGLQVAVVPAMLLVHHLADRAPRGATVASSVTEANPAAGAGRIAVNAESVVQRFGGWADVPRVLVELSGQALYLVVATYGLVLVGMVVAGVAAKRVLLRGREEPAELLAAFVGACMLGTWALSSLRIVTGGEPARTDLLLYGRYNEVVLGPVLVLGLVGLARFATRRGSRWLAWVGLTTAVTAGTAAVVGLRRAVELRGPTVRINVFGIYPLIESTGQVNVVVLAAVGAGVASLVFLLARRVSIEVACVPVAVLFVVWAVVASTDVTRASRQTTDRVLASAIAHVDARFPDAPVCVGYENRRGFDWYFFNYQVFLPEVELRRFSPAGGEGPCSTLLVAQGADANLRYPDARLVTFENNTDRGLWALPGDFASRLAAAGFLQESVVPARLPDAAFNSAIRLLDRRAAIVLESGEFRRVTLEVTHAGAGSPWPNRAGAVTGAGVVRLGLKWFSQPGGQYLSEQRAELPQTLLPQQRADVSVLLRPVDAEGRPLPPGDYEVRVSPVQEGHLHFSDVGDEPFPFFVRVTESEAAAT